MELFDCGTLPVVILVSEVPVHSDHIRAGAHKRWISSKLNAPKRWIRWLFSCKNIGVEHYNAFVIRKWLPRWKWWHTIESISSGLIWLIWRSVLKFRKIFLNIFFKAKFRNVKRDPDRGKFINWGEPPKSIIATVDYFKLVFARWQAHFVLAQYPKDIHPAIELRFWTLKKYFLNNFKDATYWSSSEENDQTGNRASG